MLESFDTTRPLRPAAYTGPERRSTTALMSRWLARMLDEVDHGMLLVSAGGQLRHANQAAWSELGRGDKLRLASGRVRVFTDGEQTTFAQALSDAARGRRRLVTLGAGAQRLSVAAVPIQGIDENNDAMALLVLGKRQSCETLTVDFFARTRGLTGAEARVLQALCKGLRPKEIAQQVGVAVSTIRTQIGSIRHKTLTESISELLAQVAALPPITSVLQGMGSH